MSLHVHSNPSQMVLLSDKMSLSWKRGKKTRPQGHSHIHSQADKISALGFVSCSATKCLFSMCRLWAQSPVLKTGGGSGSSSRPTWSAMPLCLTGTCPMQAPACPGTLKGPLLMSGRPACCDHAQRLVPGEPAAGITWASGST